MSNLPARRAAMDVKYARGEIIRLVPEFSRALPAGVDPQRFARVVQTAVQQTPKLLECSPESLWGACMKAAQDGLLPDGREGAIVPRWNSRVGSQEAHWMPMVAGLIAKAKRKGSVASLSANIVYEGEEFDVLLGDDDRIVHRRDVTKVRAGAEIAVYAIATLRDGSKEREVMSWEQAMEVRAASQEGGKRGPWDTWTGEMARKSCIRRLSKRLPSLDEGDDDLKRAVERVDELYDFGKPALAAPARAAPALAQDAPLPTLDEAREPAAAEDRATVDEALQGDTIPALDDAPEAVPEWPVVSRDKRVKPLPDADAWSDEWAMRVRAVDHATQGPAQKRETLAAMLAANEGAFAAIRERGDGERVEDVLLVVRGLDDRLAGLIRAAAERDAVARDPADIDWSSGDKP